MTGEWRQRNGWLLWVALAAFVLVLVIVVLGTTR